MKTKMYGNNRPQLQIDAINRCRREGWRLAKFGARFFFGGFVAVLKK